MVEGQSELDKAQAIACSGAGRASESDVAARGGFERGGVPGDPVAGVSLLLYTGVLKRVNTCHGLFPELLMPTWRLEEISTISPAARQQSKASATASWEGGGIWAVWVDCVV